MDCRKNIRDHFLEEPNAEIARNPQIPICTKIDWNRLFSHPAYFVVFQGDDSVMECVISADGKGQSFISFNDETNNKQLLQV